MKITDALLGEHATFYALFDHIERELAGLETLKEVQQVVAMLASTLVTHAKIENEILFPALEKHIGPLGPLSVMRAEHRGIEGAFKEIASAETRDAAEEKLRLLLQTAREHFGKEEQALFGMARQAMSDAELEQLGSQWAQTRHVSIG